MEGSGNTGAEYQYSAGPIGLSAGMNSMRRKNADGIRNGVGEKNYAG